MTMAVAVRTGDDAMVEFLLDRGQAIMSRVDAMYWTRYEYADTVWSDDEEASDDDDEAESDDDAEIDENDDLVEDVAVQQYADAWHAHLANAQPPHVVLQMQVYPNV
jgi:hypothetical protein